MPHASSGSCEVSSSDVQTTGNPEMFVTTFSARRHACVKRTCAVHNPRIKGSPCGSPASVGHGFRRLWHVSADTDDDLQVLNTIPLEKLDDKAAVEAELAKAGVKVEQSSALLG